MKTTISISNNVSYYPPIIPSAVCIHAITDMNTSYGYGVYFHPLFNYFYSV